MGWRVKWAVGQQLRGAACFFEIQSAKISICFTPTVFQYYRKQLLLFMVLVLTYCGGLVVFL